MASEIHEVDIETEWNLKFDAEECEDGYDRVDIETEWNLKVGTTCKDLNGKECRYRNRVEFKGRVCFSMICPLLCRYRNRVEFKDYDALVHPEPAARRYRNRVEFKGWSC